MFAELIETIMDTNGISMEKLSIISGIPLETIRNIRYHRVRDPRASTLVALCRACHFSLDLFFDIGQSQQLLKNYSQCQALEKKLLLLMAELLSTHPFPLDPADETSAQLHIH